MSVTALLLLLEYRMPVTITAFKLASVLYGITSYTRHDYFRRILCNYLGSLVENGEYPESDLDILGEIAADISYNNAVRYFKFPLETR